MKITRPRVLVACERGSTARSRFFPGVAKAMSEQWAPILFSHYD